MLKKSVGHLKDHTVCEKYTQVRRKTKRLHEKEMIKKAETAREHRRKEWMNHRREAQCLAYCINSIPLRRLNECYL